MKELTLILDLDDTIYKTRSLDPKPFQPFFDRLTLNLKKECSAEKAALVLEEIWKRPWDKVIAEHQLPLAPLLNAIALLETLELDISLSPYPDYAFLKNLKCRKILVTTSLTSLQEKKIKALGVENDFEEIIINDPFKTTDSKLEVFKHLHTAYSLSPQTTYVIGDNPGSEIEAGNALNMITIQILRDGVEKGNNAKHYIRTFTELEHILLFN